MDPNLYPKIDFDLEAEEAKWFASLEVLLSLQQIDCEYYLNHALAKGQKILAEGAQGSMLDIDFGTYPYVTSSNTVTAGVCNGLGIAPQKIGEVIGISKAYCTRVGSGPFPTELDDEIGAFLGEEGQEFGATTGRPRRCGWIDLPQLNYTIMLNGVTDIVVTKLDILNIFSQIEMATAYRIDGQLSHQLPYDILQSKLSPEYEAMQGWEQSLDAVDTYEDLPAQAKAYVEKLEGLFGVPISMVSTGPERRKLLERAVYSTMA